MALILAPINCAHASKEELLDLEEEKSDIEDRIEEARASGKSYDDLEERRNDVQDEMDNVRDGGWDFCSYVFRRAGALLCENRKFDFFGVFWYNNYINWTSIARGRKSSAKC